jgi:hypothetical protein
VAQRDEEDDRPSKRVRRDEPTLSIKPLGVVRGLGPGASSFRKETPATTPTVPPTPVSVSNQPSKGSLSQIIEQAMEDARRAQAEQEAQAAAVAAEEKRLLEEKALRKQKAKEKRQKEKGKDSSKPRASKDKHSSQAATNGESSISNKEKRLLKLIGAAVVGYLSQWRSRFQSSDEFKRHAKEVSYKPTDLINNIEGQLRSQRRLQKRKRKVAHTNRTQNSKHSRTKKELKSRITSRAMWESSASIPLASRRRRTRESRGPKALQTAGQAYLMMSQTSLKWNPLMKKTRKARRRIQMTRCRKILTLILTRERTR